MSRTRRSWGLVAVREMARYRLSRAMWVGAHRVPRAAQVLGTTHGPRLGTATGLAQYQAWRRRGGGRGRRL